MADAVMWPILGQSLSDGGAAGGRVSATSEYPSNTERSGGTALVAPNSGEEPPGCAMGYRTWEELDAGSDTNTLVIVDWSSAGGTLLTDMSAGDSLYTALTGMVTTANSTHNVRVPGVVLIQGERDQSEQTPQATYQTQLSQLREDLNADIQAITGQSDEVKLFVTQTCSWPEYATTEPTVGLAQLAESVADPNVFLVGPQYPCGYVGDEVHMTANGYYHLGEYIARALIGQYDTNYWEPLRPLSAIRSGAVVTVEFNVPVAPLKFDTTTVAAQTNQGFSYTDDGTPPAISSVALGGNGTSVEITLASTPTGANQKVRYGFTTQYGNLCDSETATSVNSGDTLANWCVHFEMDVTT